MSQFVKLVILCAGADPVTKVQDLEETNGKVTLDLSDIGAECGIEVTALSQDEARDLRKLLAVEAAKPVAPAPFDPAPADEPHPTDNPPEMPRYSEDAAENDKPSQG